MRRVFLWAATWLVLAVGTMLFLGSRNWWNYYRLSKRGVQTQGAVVSREPHMEVRYSYRVGETTHTATGRPINENLATGAPVTVVYLPYEPTVSACAAPEQLMSNEAGAVIMATIVFPTFFLTVVWWKLARRASRNRLEQ